MNVWLPSPSPFPALDSNGITVDEAMMTLALLLNGDANRDGDIILDFCETFRMSPDAIYREIFTRCVFPESWHWTLH